MRLSVLSSGSSGNATYIETASGGLLVDAGLSCRRIEGLLALIGRSLSDVGAVLLTHGHADHTSGVRSLIRECGVGVFAAPGVGGSLGATTVEAGEAFVVGGIEAVFFEVPHDSSTYGLRVSDGQLSNQQAAEAGLALAPHGLKDLIHAHLSKTNNSPARACGTVHRVLREAGHGGVRVRAAIAGHPTPPIEVGTPLKTAEYVYSYEEPRTAERLFDME